METAERVTH